MADLNFSHDFHRPSYHFLPPANWMNDPNGLIQWQGVYHLFYQHNPYAACWGPMHWGHAVSHDLLHWEHRPIAMAPTPGGADEHGCFSGVAVEHDGAPVIIYSGNRDWKQRACLAFSHDNLQTLEKYPGSPVIPETPPGYDLIHYRDHCVWKENGEWRQLIGAGIKDQGGAVFLYRSQDLIHWEFARPLLAGDQGLAAPLSSGTMWECPDFFALGTQHALLVSIHEGNPLYSAYFLGDYQEGVYKPRVYRRLDYGEWEFYAAQSFLDDNGRRVQFGWINEARSPQAQLAAGWAGMLSLPRLLEPRPDGWLGIRPHPALERLRGQAYNLGETILPPGANLPLEVDGPALEIKAVFAAPGEKAGEFGLKVFCSPPVQFTGDEDEQTLIVYDPARGWLEVRRERSSLDAATYREPRGGPLELVDGEDLELHVFLDHSVIEVIANGRVSLTCRVYPSRPESTGVKVYTTSSPVRLRCLEAWEIEAVW